MLGDDAPWRAVSALLQRVDGLRDTAPLRLGPLPTRGDAELAFYVMEDLRRARPTADKLTGDDPVATSGARCLCPYTRVSHAAHRGNKRTGT